MGGDPISTIVGAGMGLISGIGSIFNAKKSNKILEELTKKDPIYTANPEVAGRLALAKNLLNARMPGSSAMEKNIFTNQANQIADVEKYATDSSQALARVASVGGQTNQNLANVGLMEQQDYQRRYGNYVNASDASVQEGQNVFQDQVRRFDDLAKIRGAQAQNRQAIWDNIGNAGGATMNFGLSGGWDNLFPKRQQNQMNPSIGGRVGGAINYGDQSMNNDFYGSH